MGQRSSFSPSRAPPLSQTVIRGTDGDGACTGNVRPVRRQGGRARTDAIRDRRPAPVRRAGMPDGERPAIPEAPAAALPGQT